MSCSKLSKSEFFLILPARRSEAEVLQQFLQDVAMARDLSHPHLLPVVGAVISPSDDPMVVMPFMATEDLGSYVREPAKVSDDLREYGTLSVNNLLRNCLCGVRRGFSSFIIKYVGSIHSY